MMRIFVGEYWKKSGEQFMSKKKSAEKECIGDLKAQFVSQPRFQRHVRFSPNQAAGAVALAWYRGIRKGREEMYTECLKALKRKYPEAAKALKNKVDA